MKAADRIVGREEDRVDVLDDAVGRQAPLRLPEIHRASAGMKAKPELSRHLDLGLQQALDASGKDIVMIGRGRAAAKRQLGQPDLRRRALPIRIDRRPGWIKLAEPVKEPALLRMDPRQGLVQMMVRVDEARNGQQTMRVDGLRLFADRWAPSTDPADDAAIDQ